MDHVTTIILPIVITIWTFVTGWFINLLLKFSNELKVMDRRISMLEQSQAVDDSEKKTIFNLLKTVETKIDMILDPAFFKRCPNQHLYIRGKND